MKPNHISELDWKLLKEKYPNNIKEIIEKLNKNYPVQYLIGDVEFLNTRILVDERVLIPRFETEFLVQKTVQKIKKLNLEKTKIIDLGCGSGCIGIALKKNLNCEVTCVDISEAAISLAKENSYQNKVEIQFIKEDMQYVELENYDIIISNPPYVNEKEPVGKETSYEPQNAIFAPNDGLYFYELIIKKIKNAKEKPKLIAFEIGYQQGNLIKELTQQYLSTYSCIIEKDLAGKERYAFLEKCE